MPYLFCARGAVCVFRRLDTQTFKFGHFHMSLGGGVVAAVTRLRRVTNRAFLKSRGTDVLHDLFSRDAWIEAIKRSPQDYVVSGVFSFLMTWLAIHIGVPTLDLLPWPLTGLGYALMFFIFCFLSFGLLAFGRWRPAASPCLRGLFLMRSPHGQTAMKRSWIWDAVFYAVHGCWPGDGSFLSATGNV